MILVLPGRNKSDTIINIIILVVRNSRTDETNYKDKKINGKPA